MSDTQAAPAYTRIADMIEAGRCVILDGGIGTELPRAAGSDRRARRAAVGRAGADRRAGRGAARARDATWRPAATSSRRTRGASRRRWPGTPACGTTSRRRCTGWTIARRGIRLARQAIADARARGRVRGRVLAQRRHRPRGRPETVPLLERAFATTPPDLILLETLSLVRPSLFGVVEPLLETGAPGLAVVPALPPRPVRRLRPALGRARGRRVRPRRAALRGARACGALLINCIPPDHVDGMISYLRDFTDLPLGVYPNLGYCTNAGWRFDVRGRRRAVRGDGAALARGGRADRRRLLRHAARAHRRGARGAARRAARPPPPGRRGADDAGIALARRPRRSSPWPTAGGARSPRCRSRS